MEMLINIVHGYWMVEKIEPKDKRGRKWGTFTCGELKTADVPELCVTTPAPRGCHTSLING